MPKKTYMVEKVLTPVGVASFPNIDKPDTRWDADGAYSADVVVGPGEETALQAKLEALAEEFRKEQEIGSGVEVHIPIKPETDRDKQPTGNVLIKTKLKAFVGGYDGSEKVSQRPKVVDGQTNPIHPVPAVGGGSKMRVACDAIARYVQGKIYVTLNIRAVQIVELVLKGSGDPSEYGMEELEGAYVAETSSDDLDF